MTAKTIFSRLRIGAVLTGLACVLACMYGCESDSARSPVRIDPGQVEMRRGQTHEFVATGGYDYRWSIDNKEIGLLTRTADNHRVLYTAARIPENGGPVTQVLRVVSYISGASQPGTQTNRYGVSAYQVHAEAFVVQY